MLRDFHERHYTADRMVVLGLNVDHDQAVNYGELLTMGKGSGASAGTSQFHGGQEIRQPTGDPHTILAVATSASSAANVKEAVATIKEPEPAKPKACIEASRSLRRGIEPDQRTKAC